MKKHFIILITLLTTSILVKAQEEYRINKSTGQLKLNVTGVIVEGYEGKEIIFSGKKIKVEEVDERAKGLVPVSSSKYTDNTGLGISVVENGENVNVNLVAKEPIGLLTIKVPQNIKVSISNYNYNNYTMLTINNSNSNNNSEDVVLKNLKNEIEVSVYNNKVRLENNTGPMNIKTMSGAVEAVFSSDIKGPVSIISATNYVDVTMSANTKANIEMSTNSGKLYAGKEFKIDLDKSDAESNYSAYGLSSLTGNNRIGNGTVTLKTIKDGSISTTTVAEGVNIKENKSASGKSKSSGEVKSEGVSITGTGSSINPIYIDNRINGVAYSFGSAWTGGDRIKGKLNGGGIDLIFKSNNKNVYLRQQ